MSFQRNVYRPTASLTMKSRQVTPILLIVATCFVYEVTPATISGDESEKAKVPESREKRFSSFVRIGKGSQLDNKGEDLEKLTTEVDSLMKMTSEMGDVENDIESVDDDLFGSEEESEEQEGPVFDKKASRFLRIGRHPFLMHRFIRIGRNGGQQTGFSDGSVAADINDEVFDQMNKRQSSFVRIGKALSNFVRIGKSHDTASDFQNEDSDNYLKRASNFVRIGKGSNFVRIGKANPMDRGDDKRASNFVRIGKNVNEQFDDLPVGQPLLGYSFPEDSQSFSKRASRFVGFGKADNVATDKRLSNFVRIGKSEAGMPYFRNPFNGINRKRTSSFVRIGKEPYINYLRPVNNKYKQLKSSRMFHEDQNLGVNKRGAGFVRIGRFPAKAYYRPGKTQNYRPEMNQIGFSPKQLNRFGK